MNSSSNSILHAMMTRGSGPQIPTPRMATGATAADVTLTGSPSVRSVKKERCSSIAIFDKNHPHWPSTARHEAGHAVASIVLLREAGWDWRSFDCVLIRSGATAPYVDRRRGRDHDCVGIVEFTAGWDPGVLPGAVLRNVDPRIKELWQVLMNMEIVGALAGPFAQARALGGNSKTSAKWHALFTGGCEGDYKRAEVTIADMRAMTRRGSLRKFEDQTYTLVKRYWPAIDALGELLLQRQLLEYDEAAALVMPLLG